MKKNYGRSDFLEFVSPDFTSFIDVDTGRKRFMIRNMRTEEKTADIPHHIMHYNEDPEEMMLKFKWVSNDMFKVINTEGIEKLVDTGAGFKQENFNKVHNFDYKDELDRNFYFARRPLTPDNILERLRRKA